MAKKNLGQIKAEKDKKNSDGSIAIKGGKTLREVTSGVYKDETYNPEIGTEGQPKKADVKKKSRFVGDVEMDFG